MTTAPRDSMGGIVHGRAPEVRDPQRGLRAYRWLVVVPLIALVVGAWLLTREDSADRRNLDSLWEATASRYLKSDLWSKRDANDANHFLMVPLHASFVLEEERWLADIAEHARRFTAAGLAELPEDALSRLEYLYLWSRFLVLAADRERLDLVPPGLDQLLMTELHAAWVERPAWQWDREPFEGGMHERVLWKLNTDDVDYSYYRAIIDEELYAFAIAGDLRGYERLSGRVLGKSRTLEEILHVARATFTYEVGYLDDERWLFQPGVWTDHPDFRYAGHIREVPGMPPAPVDGIALDSSHSHRFPLWIRSLAGAYEPGTDERQFYERLLSGLERQFFSAVLEPPTAEFGAYRTRNFMDGHNGVFRWEYQTQGPDEGYGPYELSGTLLDGWWAFLGTDRACSIYADTAQRFPLPPEVVKVYVGPNTTRERHPLVRSPDSLENGFHELIVSLAGRLCSGA